MRRIGLDVSPDARAWLTRTGYDPLYGARPLHRLVQTAIGDPLARMLLSGEVLDGSTVRGRTAAPEATALTLTPRATAEPGRPAARLGRTWTMDR